MSQSIPDNDAQVASTNPEPVMSPNQIINVTKEQRPVTYMEALKKLTEEFPYIAYTKIKAGLGSPEKAATLTVIDVDKSENGGKIRDQVVYQLKNYTSKLSKNHGGRLQMPEDEQESLDSMLNTTEPNIAYRVIMIEGINARTIDLLGREFPGGIDPDLLVEHLALQRHRKERFEKVQKFIPRRKNYISLQWSRVFVHHDGRETPEGGGGGADTMVLGNTVPRPFSRLWIENCPEHSMGGTGDPGEPEEPMPGQSISGQSRSGTPTSGNPEQVPGRSPPAALGNLTPGSSTPGGSGAMKEDSKPGSQAAALGVKSPECPSTPGQAKVYAHYECASVCWVRSPNADVEEQQKPPIVLLLLDPLPQTTDPDYKIVSYDHCRGEWDSKSRNAPELPVGVAHITQLEEDDPQEWTGDQARAKTTEFDWRPKDALEVNLPLNPAKRSTTETLKYDLESTEAREKYQAMKLTNPSEMVLRLLFRIIERDSYVLLATISEALHEIHTMMHVSEDIHQDMAVWQEMFVTYREHVFSIRRCISNVINNLKALHVCTDIHSLAISRHPGHKSTKIANFSSTTIPDKPILKDREFHDDLVSLLEQAETVYIEIQETSNSLMSIISILDSERAIIEAEGVTKLTELAFFFIPLAFSSTLFGMQVKEVNGSSPVSIYTWVVVACCIILASYSVRLAVRSRFMRETKEKLFKEVRVANGFKKKTAVPLLIFLGHQTTKLLSVGLPDDSASGEPQHHTLAGFTVVICGFLIFATVLIWIIKTPLPQLVKIALTCGFNIPWLIILCGAVIYKQTRPPESESSNPRGRAWTRGRKSKGVLNGQETGTTFIGRTFPIGLPRYPRAT